MTMFDHVWNRVGNAKPLQAGYGDYIGEGGHTLALIQMRLKPLENNSTIIACEFMVLQSGTNAHGQPSHSPGQKVGCKFDVGVPAQQWQVDKAFSLCNAFVSAMLGLPPRTDPGEVAKQCAWLCDPAQGGRGLVVMARGVTSVGKKSGKPFTNVTFSNAPNQTQQTIAQMRTEIERLFPECLQVPVQQQAPTGYQQPAQMPVAQPYAAPPQGYAPPPAWAPQPVQGGYVQQVQPPPQGYTGGYIAQQPTQVQPAQPPAQGGYLGLLPGQGR